LLNTIKGLEESKKGTVRDLIISDADYEKYYFKLSKENNEVIIRGKIGDYTNQSLKFYFSIFEQNFNEIVNKMVKIITEIKTKLNL